ALSGMTAVLCLNDRTRAVWVTFINYSAPTVIYTLSLHDALPICRRTSRTAAWPMTCSTHSDCFALRTRCGSEGPPCGRPEREARSEEHTSELQSLAYLVCRLLLEKKNTKKVVHTTLNIRRSVSVI